MSEPLATARRLAATLAESAWERDRAGAPPFAEIALMRESGLLRLLVPRAAGGSGAGWADAVAITRIVSAADASMGHLLGYHYLNHLSALFAATPDQAREIERGLVEESWFLGDSVNPLDPGLSISRAGETITLSGRRSFATGAAVADRILLTFKFEDRGAAILLPRNRAGVRPNDDWDNLGQRLTASGSIDFSDVAVGTDEILGPGLDAPPAPSKPSPMSAMIQTTLGAVQTGIAAGALEAGAAYTRTHSRAWSKSGHARAVDDPLVAAPYGQLSARLAAADALLTRTAEAIAAAIERRATLGEDERAAISLDSFRLKIVSTEVALETSAKIFELMGARATANRFGFDRYWRDARTLSLHDPVAYKALEIGRHLLSGERPEPTTYS